ncbi:MAG: phosphate acyltransferase PlsX [Clostridiales bacterium]|nr:phosphate acyltransferase PlsX [Clostridiales bacterium]
MKVIVDAMGGDFAPREAVLGAIWAAREHKIEITLVGRGEEILACLEEWGIKSLPKGIEIAYASEVVDMEDDPSTVIRTKKDSSMSVALNLLKEGKGDALVSAGSTGALLSGATLIVKRIRGVRRAALAPLLPTNNGGCLLIDCGANVECTPEYLLQFAYMGSCYVANVLKKPGPRVGLLNIGSEPGKGGELQREAYRLLSEQKEKDRLNFIGNIEARDVLEGVADVVVCDGFTGNILLKSIEGTAKFIVDGFKDIFLQSVLTKLAAAIIKNPVREFKKRLDYTEVGGTLFLGVSKPVIKAHGSSNANAFANAIRQAAQIASAGIIEDIQDKMWDIKTGEE